MTDYDLRMQCMQLAAQLHANQPSEVLRAARAMYNFVIANEPQPADVAKTTTISGGSVWASSGDIITKIA